MQFSGACVDDNSATINNGRLADPTFCLLYTTAQLAPGGPAMVITLTRAKDPPMFAPAVDSSSATWEHFCAYNRTGEWYAFGCDQPPIDGTRAQS